MGGACGTNGEMSSVYRVVVGKPGGKRQLGRSKSIWIITLKYTLKKSACRAWT
jgi:hypothetical protein